MSIIALLTDFGASDHYVGSMKAAIFSVNPRALIVDITHGVPPGDKVCGAFSLLMSYRDFPKSTIFVAVIDPGVGDKRNAIAIKCGGYFFIGPDNGVLSMTCDDIAAPMVVRTLANRYFRNPVSATFHGRDIFGPIAAHLSKGVAFEKLGPTQDSFLSCRLPQVIIEPHRIKGSVAYIDHFGNCITSITTSHLKQQLDSQPVITIKRGKSFPLCSRYDEVPKGKPLGILGSTGFLEVSINCGNAAETLKVKRGDPVKVDVNRKTLKLSHIKTDT